MKMMVIGSLVVLSLVLRYTEAVVAVYPAKIGETLILDVGRDVKEWARVRDGQEETIRLCKNGKSKICNKWVDSDLKPIGDDRSQISDNGTLIITNFQSGDAGDYYTNDELERVHYTADGHIWKLARTRISVIAI